MTAQQQARLAFLEGRRVGIGSSDVAPILGLSPWGTAFSVYQEKVNPPNVEGEIEAPLEWGIRKEPVIAGAIMDHHGWKLAKPQTIAHAEHPFLIASVDRENDAGEPIEIKTARTDEGWGDAETDEVPEHYWLQIQHQLEVRRSQGLFAEFIWVFVLVGSSDFRRYRVARDETYLGLVIEPLTAFWACVEARTPPEPDWNHDTTTDAIKAVFKPEGGEITLGADAVAAADLFTKWQEAESSAKKQKEAAKARLQFMIGTATLGLLPDGRTLTNKMVQRKGYTVEPCEYPLLNLKKAK